MARHKHADLICAWAEGAEIQWKKTNGEWIGVGNDPVWMETDEYRINPQPKSDYVLYDNVSLETKADRLGNKHGDVDAANHYWEHLNTEINRLHRCLRNVYEVWAGSEGIPAPIVASEAYLLSLVEQMRDAAKEGLNGG
jgi:hypothetical protein